MPRKYSRFQCPDGHKNTIRPSGFPFENKRFEKLWCDGCKRFFYVNNFTEERLFELEVCVEMQSKESI